MAHGRDLAYRQLDAESQQPVSWQNWMHDSASCYTFREVAACDTEIFRRWYGRRSYRRSSDTDGFMHSVTPRSHRQSLFPSRRDLLESARFAQALPLVFSCDCQVRLLAVEQTSFVVQWMPFNSVQPTVFLQLVLFASLVSQSRTREFLLVFSNVGTWESNTCFLSF